MKRKWETAIMRVEKVEKRERPLLPSTGPEMFGRRAEKAAEETPAAKPTALPILAKDEGVA